ncbi:hypothetical protein [Sandaracinus amylolyticus]|uniref:hypothetical protein n=1 Tax=Sandaracinus amylolyticus TaxID=927083 RepID=UPI001F42BA70|nr:hypothetical protein [Sandaracinus amylolyticus]UJR78579.1 Hypothetical protein I5071_6090 [Sandaracinus amylolyticus]
MRGALVMIAIVASACSSAPSEPECAAPGGWVASLEIDHAPGALTTPGPITSDEARPMSPEVAFEVRGTPEVRDGVVTLRSALVNRSASAQQVDVLTGGVPGLSSNPLAIRPLPEPAWRVGREPSTMQAPEVYPSPARWVLAPGAEVRLVARYCLARHELASGTRVRFERSFEAWHEPKPRGDFEIVVP